MTPKRPISLKWVGAMLPDGRPEKYLDFLVPGEHVDEARTAELTQDQLAAIRHNPDLYQEVHEKAPKQKASGSHPKAHTATKPAEPDIVPDTAAEPATESEG